MRKQQKQREKERKRERGNTEQREKERKREKIQENRSNRVEKVCHTQEICRRAQPIDSNYQFKFRSNKVHCGAAPLHSSCVVWSQSITGDCHAVRHLPTFFRLWLICLCQMALQSPPALLTFDEYQAECERENAIMAVLSQQAWMVSACLISIASDPPSSPCPGSPSRIKYIEPSPLFMCFLRASSPVEFCLCAQLTMRLWGTLVQLQDRRDVQIVHQKHSSFTMARRLPKDMNCNVRFTLQFTALDIIMHPIRYQE